MSDLSEFLLARIADEEGLARDAASEGSPPRTGWQIWTSKIYTTPGGEVLGPRGTVEAHPTRVLAECTAKRAIVELHNECGTGTGYCDDGGHGWGWLDGGGCSTLAALALPYADHADCQPEWKP